MRDVPVTPIALERLTEVLPPEWYAHFERELTNARERLSGRTLWHVNSTDAGGGVAELLQSVVGYLGAFVDCRWLVIDADDEFFRITKQIHHLLHGKPGDGDLPGAADRSTYEAALAANLNGPSGKIRAGDVVILHDPQTVGLAPTFRSLGATVLWSCHVGADEPNDYTRAAWKFLLPYVRGAHAQVFSRRAYIWEGLSPETAAVIPPCIDACSAKNQALGDETVAAILAASGVVDERAGGRPTFRRLDGSLGIVARTVDMIEEQPLRPGTPIVVQVSRWDPLKDPVGVLHGVVDHVPDAHVLLAGPALSSVDDDPEADQVLKEVRKAWEDLPLERRARAHLACVPMEDVEENAAIVNAVQRRGDVVAQKSLAEGFGLTVAEAMWKGRPTIGSRVGGIQDQIVHRENGLLVDDPRDLAAFGAAARELLENRAFAADLGARAHARAGDEFILPRYIARWLDLIERVDG